MIIRRKLYSMSGKDKLALGLAGSGLIAPLIGGSVGALRGALKNTKSKSQKDIEDMEKDIKLLKEDVKEIEKAKKSGKAWYDENMQDWTSSENTDEAGLNTKKEWIKDYEKKIKELRSKSSSELRKRNIKEGWEKGKIVGAAIGAPSIIGGAYLATRGK